MNTYCHPIVWSYDDFNSFEHHQALKSKQASFLFVNSQKHNLDRQKLTPAGRTLTPTMLTHRAINTLLTTLLGLTIIAFTLPQLDHEKYDVRNEFLLILLEGGIHAVLIVAIAILLTYKTIKIENEKKSNGLISFLMLLLSVVTLITCLFTLKFISPPYEDTVIYKSTREPFNYIIVQHYETGITGNPRHRIIKTSNIETIFRKITLLPDTLLKTMPVGERNSDNPIKSFIEDNVTYKLETYCTK